MKITENVNSAGKTAHVQGEKTRCRSGKEAQLSVMITEDMKAVWFIYLYENGEMISDSMYSQHWRAMRDFNFFTTKK